MKKLMLPAWVGTSLAFALTSFPAVAQQAIAPYQLSVFANAPSGMSAPDSIAVLGNSVFVGYGDGHAPDGSDGLSSQIVQYDVNGHVEHTYNVLGHNDGLKVNPASHLLWAMQNEDFNPNLVVINPVTHLQKTYTFAPTLHGGGYDDMVFRGCKVYLSASNPANNPNSGPAIVSAKIEGTTVQVSPVFAGQAEAIDITTGTNVQLNLLDPDSMTVDTLGNIVLDSQGDDMIIIVSNPGASNQRVLRLPLKIQSSGALIPVEVDDTNFATSSQGFILFTDKGLNTIYKLSSPAFAPGVAYTAADGAMAVGTLDLRSGVITPIVTGLSGPGGLVFVDTSKPFILDPPGSASGLLSCAE
jgi:hypothetical protein